MKRKTINFIKKVFKEINNCNKNREPLGSLLRRLDKLLTRSVFSLSTGLKKATMQLARNSFMVHGLIFDKDVIIGYSKKVNKAYRKSLIKKKKQDLKLMIMDSRSTGHIFYICSSHKDCAKDHIDYQGKIYVDKFWRSIIKGTSTEPLFKAIEHYIKQNDIKTLQWITSEPVYMLTRPYCRHYMKSLNTLTVLFGGVDPSKFYDGARTQRQSTYKQYQDIIRFVMNLKA